MADRIDEHVVSMTFDNDRFEEKLAETIVSLDKLRESLDFAGAAGSMGEISAAAQGVDLSTLAEGVDNISSKFSTLGAIGFTVIQNLTNGLLSFASTIKDKFKEDVLAPIITGGRQRALNIEQAKFLFRGLSLDVEQGMESALKAVKGTAFGLDEAAKIAAQLGASGVKPGEKMTEILRGIAGAAAMTGSSFREIGDIFAQSAALGRVTGQDLNQFATRGLNAAAAIAKALGKTEQEVRKMASEGQLDFNTFSVAMNKAFGEHATKANETYAGSLANVRAAMSRLGESIFAPRLEHMKNVFNTLSPVIDNVAKALKPLINVMSEISRIGSERIIKLLQGIDFKPIEHGIKVITFGVFNLFQAFNKTFDVIKQAFKNVFPPSVVPLFVKLSEVFLRLTENLKPTARFLEVISHVFTALFGTLKTGWIIIKEVFLLFRDLLGPLKGSGDGLLDFIDKIALLIIKFNTLMQGGAIHSFFITLREVINQVSEVIVKAKTSIQEFFENFFNGDSDKAEGEVGRVQQRVDSLKSAIDHLKARFQEFKTFWKPIVDEMSNAIGEFAESFKQKISDAFGPADFNSAVDAVNVGLLGGILFYLRKFIKGGVELDLLDIRAKIEGVFQTFTDKAKAMTANIKADTLLKIAAAMAVLTISLVALSLIDSVALTKALLAIAAGFAMMFGVMAAMDKIGGDGGGKKGLLDSFVGDKLGGVAQGGKLGLMAAAMVVMATSMVILAGAIAILGHLDIDQLAKGLGAIAISLGLMIFTMNEMSKNPLTPVAAGAVVVLATGLTILAGAVSIFAALSLGELAKGLGAVFVTLGLMTTALKEMSKNPLTPVAAAAFSIMAVGLNILAGAVSIFATMNLSELAKGLGAVFVTLGLMIMALQEISKNPLNIVAAAAFLGVAVGLTIIAGAVKLLASIALGDMIKGLGALAVMMGILVIGVNALQGAVLGAGALIIIAGALAILAGVLKLLGGLSLQELLIGLLAITAVISLLAFLATVLQPIVPVMLLLGIALAAIGGAFLLFGAGVQALAKGLELLAKSGTKGFEVLAVGLPRIFRLIVTEAIKFLEDLLNAIPILVKIITVILDQLLETIIKLVPKLAQALSVFITEFILLVREKVPDLIGLGLELILMLLQGIANNIGKLLTAGVDILVNLIKGLIDNKERLVEAAIQLIASFAGTFAENLDKIIGIGVNILTNLLLGITSNVIKIIETVTFIITTMITELALQYIKIAEAGTKALVAFLTAMADNITEIAGAIARLVDNIVANVGALAERFVRAGTQALISFLQGLGKNIKEIADAAVQFVGNIIDAIVSVLDHAPELASRLADGFIRFFNGIANVIREKAEPLGRALGNVADALVDGFGTAFIAALKKFAEDKLPPGLGKIVSSAIGVFSHSPIERGVFYDIGGKVAVGLANGISDGLPDSVKAMTRGSNAIVDSMSNTLSKLSSSLGDTAEFNPTITPVLDLTKVQLAASNIDGLMKMSAISPDVSVARANTIATTADLTGREAAATTSQEVKEITFIQNNNSPTALSVNDIYRNTKSQIALAKEELNI